MIKICERLYLVFSVTYIICLIHCISYILNRSPTDAGLLGVITSENIGRYWTELALALGIPKAMIEDSCVTERVHTLKYWRNGNVDNADTTWDVLLKKVECLPTLGPLVVEELKSKISMEPLWTMG